MPGSISHVALIEEGQGLGPDSAGPKALEPA